MNKPVNWFLRENPIYRCITEILPGNIQYYDNSKSYGRLCLFDILNKAYDDCCRILKDDDIPNDFFEKYSCF